MLFVADELPRELRRRIEFLNQQMVSVEVLGVEIRQYVRPDVKVLVPRLVGQTELTRQGKSQRRVEPPLDPQAFLNLMPPYARGFFQGFVSEAEQPMWSSLPRVVRSSFSTEPEGQRRSSTPTRQTCRGTRSQRYGHTLSASPSVGKTLP